MVIKAGFCPAHFFFPSFHWRSFPHILSPIILANVHVEVLLLIKSSLFPQISKVSWSAPIEAMAADSAPGFCFSDVPSVTRVLPHHNKYVLADSQKTTVTHSKARGLLWKDFSHGDAESSAPSFVPLPKGCRRLPQTIAVHPSKEWIIAGFPDGQVVAMASRT